MDSHLSIKLIGGYVSSMWCKINFLILCLQRNGTHRVKKCSKILASKAWGEPKLITFSELQEMRTKLTE